MRCSRTTAAAAGIALFAGAAPLAGQIDYRNLDDERPVLTEDAYPVERYAFELLAPYRLEAEADGNDVHVVAPELSYGIISNAQVGLELPLAALDSGPDTEWGLAGVTLSGLYNFNTEGPALPALSLRGELGLPVGDLAGDVARFTLAAIATRSFGRTRLHLNAARSFGSEGGLGIEAAPRWSYSVAADHVFLRSSLLLVGEVATLRRAGGTPVEVNVGAGARWQWTPTLVLDAGLARRLRAAVGPDLALTLGLSHAFALRALVPGTRAPSRR
ncbi:MAG TPA: hypothetical protein VFU46_04475 [Gemmatimonadales bacterium]|nr:hypothetical protein [Gemmatimonadales bacterium]